MSKFIYMKSTAELIGMALYCFAIGCVVGIYIGRWVL